MRIAHDCPSRSCVNGEEINLKWPSVVVVSHRVSGQGGQVMTLNILP